MALLESRIASKTTTSSSAKTNSVSSQERVSQSKAVLPSANEDAETEYLG